MTRPTDFDVAIVGYGPTGALLSILLGQLGYRVGVFERFPSIYDLPRAVHFDDEVGRIFQAAGIRDAILAITDPVPDFYEWRNRAGEVLLAIDWATAGAQGWPTANFFTQPALQEVLDRRVRQLPLVEVNAGWEVTSVTDLGDRLAIGAERTRVESNGVDRREVTAHYLVGADGANSRIRQLMGVAFKDLGFLPFDWLIVDLLPHDRDRLWSPMNWQLCDPTRPTTVVSGGPCRRRWEFMRLPDEPLHALDTEETAWRLLEPWGMTPDTAELERHAVYRFMARYAERWRLGRVLLAGDAAHLMPPFAGQGMCNGLRDAMNLAWKLDLVLSGATPDEILDSYQTERLDHARQWIEFSAALGEVICVLDEVQAAARDAEMLAGEADPRRVLPAAPPQRLGDGVFRQDQAAAGTHFVQAPIEYAGRHGLFDDLFGHGFAMIGTDEQALAGIDASTRSLLSLIGGQILSVASDGVAQNGSFADLSGAYRAWFREHDCVAVLVRPDFYVYGVALEASDAPALLQALINDLKLAPKDAIGQRLATAGSD
jgi:2-polyprenyl-6-methoxyphenol hydroxylase-like FAD-dependent oxidoreductase